MDQREILKAFINANIHFQREGLKRFNELIGGQLDRNLLNQLVTYASELQYKILDVEKVEKLIDFIVKGKQQKSADQAKIVKDQINESIIVLDYFNQNRFIIFSSAKEKQSMALNRLKNIEKILRQDNRYVFGYQSHEAISISQIGTVIGSIDKTHNILGLLFQIKDSYYISDGMIELKVNLKNAQNRYMFTNNNPDKVDIGLINLNSVVMLNGQWDDFNGCLDVYSFSIPQFNVKKELKEQILNTDLKGRRKLDKFGVYDKIVECFMAEQVPSLERQKALNIFINIQSETVWVLSNFNLDSLVAIKTFDTLLNRYQIFCNERKISAPQLIILVGQFSTQSIPKQEILYGNELVKMLTQYQDFLRNTLIFFLPSFDDFPLAYSLPKTPLNLRLYMQEPGQNMHSVSNPCKLSICGFNVVIVRNDISKEIRKNHIQSMQADHKHLSETIISQQYVGTFNSQQVCYKWNYDEAMQLDPTVDLVVLCDQTIQQYKYQTLINDTAVLNPGNFLKGEFGTIRVNKKRQTISGDTSKIEI